MNGLRSRAGIRGKKGYHEGASHKMERKKWEENSKRERKKKENHCL